MALTKEAERKLRKRIALAERRLAKGIDLRREGRWTVSERAILERLKRELEENR